MQDEQNEIHHFLDCDTVRAALTAGRIPAKAGGRRKQYYSFFKWHIEAPQSHGFPHIPAKVSWIDPVVDTFSCRGYIAQL
ncbi:unnamed protein product [Fasciola hepatica]|uniref:Uncharacterized protein n=2 Tax=Fasciola hepatica TaxID=6192 RepID=A0ABC9HFI9_FASHE|nr:unnamed protein product [Fasciola hepatica]